MESHRLGRAWLSSSRTTLVRNPWLRRAMVAAALFLLLAGMAGAAPTVGAWYYPWYGTFEGGHRWSRTLRSHLVPQQSPALGFYNSRDAATIERHIDQSHRGNISFWAMSWWG